jgi:Ca2+-transporting ATPase
VCSIVFEAEPEEEDAMRRPPRDPSAPVFGAGMLLGALAQGALVLAAVAGLHTALRPLLGEAEARAAAFVALVLGVPALRTMFGFALPGATASAAAAALAALAVLAVLGAAGRGMAPR